MCDDQGTKITVEPGTISAGYQNFLVCIEMFFAAIALRYAFPISVYLSEGVVNGSAGRSVTMQSISSSLKVGNKIPLLDNAPNYLSSWVRYSKKKIAKKLLKNV